MTELDGGSTQSYNAADELTSGPGGSYTYNDLGERTEQTSGDTTTGYGWDQAGNLTTNTGGSSDLDLSYAYDGNGLLQSTTNSDTTTQLTWDTNNTIPLLIVDGTTNIIYGPDNLPLEQIGSDDTPIYYHHDQLGSTRLLTNADGDSVETINYSDYGTPTITSGSATTNLLYAGQYTDPHNGLIYMRARWYDPATGQFLSIDPLVARTWQSYSYADDDPVNETDPTGLCGGFLDLGCVGDAIGSGASAVAGAAVTSATWVYDHPAPAAGIALGAVSLATGVGEVAGGIAVLSDVSEGTLGVASATSGAAATVLDGKSCVDGDRAACVGVALSVPGLFSGGADVLGFEYPALDYVGLGSGASGLAWDIGTAAGWNPLGDGCG